VPQVRLIDEKGKNLGIITTSKAMALAQEKGLDLVEVQPRSRPPVVKIMDFAKAAYRQQKAARKTKVIKVKVKGVRFSLRTSEHDLQTKARQATSFLEKGHKVRAQLFLKGREKGKQDLAREKLAQFLKLIQVPIELEQAPKKHPTGLMTLLRKSDK
jgi:translation initiation factor IF-3